MTTFTYTPAERDHLQGCCETAWHYATNQHWDDVGYFRYLAAELDAEPAMHASRDYPHPDDCDLPTAAEMREQADAIEAGMIGGETL